MSTVQQFPEIHVNNLFTTIPATSNVASIIDCAGTTLCSLIVDSTLSATQLTFQSSNNPGQTWPLYAGYTGDLVTVIVPTIAPGAYAQLTVSPADFAGVRFLQIISSAPALVDSRIELCTRPV